MSQHFFSRVLNQDPCPTFTHFDLQEICVDLQTPPIQKTPPPPPDFPTLIRPTLVRPNLYKYDLSFSLSASLVQCKMISISARWLRHCSLDAYAILDLVWLPCHDYIVHLQLWTDATIHTLFTLTRTKTLLLDSAHTSSWALTVFRSDTGDTIAKWHQTWTTALQKWSPVVLFFSEFRYSKLCWLQLPCTAGKIVSVCIHENACITRQLPRSTSVCLRTLLTDMLCIVKGTWTSVGVWIENVTVLLGSSSYCCLILPSNAVMPPSTLDIAQLVEATSRSIVTLNDVILYVTNKLCIMPSHTHTHRHIRLEPVVQYYSVLWPVRWHDM